MELALYGDEGFYTKPDGGSAGRRGDFITSPEIGPLFGAVMARRLDAEWVRIGRPDLFTVLDVGAGPGTLARSVLAARPACSDAMRYVAVEVSGPQRARHPDATSVDRRPAQRSVRRRRDRQRAVGQSAVPPGRVRQRLARVVHRRRQRRSVHRAPLGPLRSGADVPAGFRGLRSEGPADRSSRDVRRTTPVPSCAADPSWRSTTALRSRRCWRADRGATGCVPIAATSVEITISLRPARRTSRSRSPSTSCQNPTRFEARRSSCTWGIEELVEEGRRIWTEQAARPGLEAMRMRSRISEAEALLDPDGLGGFLVAEWQA